MLERTECFKFTMNKSYSEQFVCFNPEMGIPYKLSCRRELFLISLDVTPSTKY